MDRAVGDVVLIRKGEEHHEGELVKRKKKPNNGPAVGEVAVGPNSFNPQVINTWNLAYII